METAADGCWADLHGELLVCIAAGNGLSLRDYNCLRGVCTAWRAALASPHPYLLSVVGGGASVFSLPMQRLLHLCVASYTTLDDESRHKGICSRTRVVGSGNGRFAVAIGYRQSARATRNTVRSRRGSFWTERILLLNPRKGTKVQLPPPDRQLRYDRVSKIVFAPNPNDDTVVAMYGPKAIACIDSGNTDDMQWTAIDVLPGYSEHLVDLVFDDAGGGKVYCLDSRGGVRVVQIPRDRSKCDEPGPVAVEPSLSVLSFPGAAVFASPYKVAFAKNLFFCMGSLYQVWQNTSATVRSGDGTTMYADEIFVLRYNPGRWPYCWDVANDLGGCSVFVGKNNSPAVAPAGAIPGVQADCLYWIDWRGVPMVCDVAIGTSRPCALSYGGFRANCWYFEVDNMTRIQPSTAARQTKRRRDESEDYCRNNTEAAWRVRPKRQRLILG